MKQYENLAKAIYDIGKYSFAALVVGQFIAEKFSMKATIAGIAFTLLAFYTAVEFEKIKES
ncbi:MAG: hypothetical protein M0Z89_10325 [Nitrospiraceae bacterium]|nr:hypothetical protein [Nitrospiraceae bacterium]